MKNPEKKLVFSIRKFKAGVASVVIGMGMVSGGVLSPVLAEETGSATTSTSSEQPASETTQPTTSEDDTTTETPVVQSPVMYHFQYEAEGIFEEEEIASLEEVLAKIEAVKESYVLETDPTADIQAAIQYMKEHPGEPSPLTSVNVVATSKVHQIPALDIKDEEGKATFKYVDVSDPANVKELKVEEIIGKVGDDILYDTRRIISEFKQKGYVLKNDGFLTTTEDKKFFTPSQLDKPQEYIIEFVPKFEVVTTVNKRQPQSGQPVEPGVVNTPVWPDGSENIEAIERSATMIVNYRRLEDGKEVYKPVRRETRFERYAIIDLTTGNIRYTPWRIIYVATQESPTSEPVVTLDLRHKVDQAATIRYVDVSTGTTLKEDTAEGESAYPIEYSTLATISDLKRQGYDVIGNDYDTQLHYYDTDTTVDQTFIVSVTPRYEWIFPGDAIPTPNTKVDEDVEDSPQWPTSVTSIDRHRQTGRVIHYLYEADRTKAADDVTDKVDFERTAKVNLVTKDILYRNWVLKGTTETTKSLEDVDSPFVRGYLASVKATGAVTLEVTSPIHEVTVLYKKLGSWIPISPIAGLDLASQQYPNDKDEDPTKAGLATDEGVQPIPYVEGYDAFGPDDTKLELVDEADPTKGYKAPAVPADPTKDTIITYQKAPEKPTPEPGKPTPEKPVPGQKELPNTGVAGEGVIFSAAAAAVIAGVGLAIPKKKKKMNSSHHS